jgi:DUF971 family protein
LHRQSGIGKTDGSGTTIVTAPKELRVSKDRKLLTVTFPDREPMELSAELLRVASPSAEVQGHSPEQRVTVPGKRNVAILKIEPVGNYAVRITFDDFHDTGIFTWAYLLELGQEKEARWDAYLAELQEKGMSRG